MLLLFDIDGTLITCQGAGRRALEDAMTPFLGPGGLNGIRLDGKTDPQIVGEAFVARRGHDATESELALVRAAYLAGLQREVAAPAQVRVLPGVEAGLARAAGAGKQRLLALATGNWRAGARIKLEAVGLWGRFAGAALDDDDGRRDGGFGCDARDRGRLVGIARARGEATLGRALRDDEVLVIGDTPHDVRAAQAARATAVAVTTGAYDEAALWAAGAAQVFADLEAAMAWALA